MNILKRIKSASVVILLILVNSCSPIENRDELSNSFSPDNIQLEAVNATPGSNKVSIKMSSPGVAGYWDYLIGIGYTNEIKDIVFPFTGKHTLTYHVTTPYMPVNGDPSKYEFVSKSIDVTISQLDTRLADAYYLLVGKNLEGKTWVFDGVGGDGGGWFSMTDPGNPGAIWWDAGGSCCPPYDVNGRMVFDVAGGLNITTYSSPTDANPRKGTYGFNSDYSKLTITGGTNILGSYNDASGAPHGNAGNNGVFTIITLTDNIMTLWVPTCSSNTGWIWRFKAQ